MQIDTIVKGGIMELEVKISGKSVNFKSEILHIINDSVLIAPIKVDEHTVGFNETCRTNFLYVIDGKLTIWENVAVKLVRYDGGIYHKIDVIGEGKPYNRREAYRLFIGEEMPIYLNTAAGPKAVSVRIKDISETGVGFLTKEEIDVERTFRLKLKDTKGVINLNGVIVRKEFLETLASYLYGGKFHEKSEQLARFIARKQGEALRKKNEPALPRSGSKIKSGEAVKSK